MKIQIKLENYNNVYQQNNLPPQYSDYAKDANGHQPKPEPPLKFSSELLAPTIPVSTQPSPMMQGYIPEINSCIPMLIPPTTCGPSNSISGSTKSDFRKSDGMVSQKNDYCFNDNASISPALSSTEPSFRKYQCLDGSVNLAQSGQPNSEKPQQSSAAPQTQSAFVTPPRTSSTVSEALFVQIIVSRCKRIAPLWFRGISSMRERNREENRRTSTNSGQTQNDWSIIAGKIRVRLSSMSFLLEKVLVNEIFNYLQCNSKVFPQFTDALHVHVFFQTKVLRRSSRPCFATSHCFSYPTFRMVFRWLFIISSVILRSYTLFHIIYGSYYQKSKSSHLCRLVITKVGGKSNLAL